MSFTFSFRLIDRSWGVACNDLEIQVGEHGDIEGVWIDGEDLSDNGEAMKMVVLLIGEKRIQKMWTDAALAIRTDELVSAKRALELKLEGA